MQWDDINSRLRLAFFSFGLNDHELFMACPLERPASTRIAMYMQPLFPEYHLDSEYGRFEVETKNLNLNTITQATKVALEAQGLTKAFEQWIEKDDVDEFGDKLSLDSKQIVPDMLVHRRRLQTHNLLFTEIKPSHFDEFDSVKLCLVTSGIKVTDSIHPLKYDFGIQLNLNLSEPLSAGSGASARLWKDGRVINELEYKYLVP